MEKTIYLVNFVNALCDITVPICVYDTKEEAEKAVKYVNRTDIDCCEYPDEVWYEIKTMTIYVCHNFDESEFKKIYESVMLLDYKTREEE